MKVFFYVLVACLSGLICYKLGVSRTLAVYKRVLANEMYDYQIQVSPDTVWVYDRGRMVGWHLIDWGCGIDSVIINDNK